MNRLAGEISPYLRQHRDNPVDWYPWGPEAFAAAAERDVPVLVSVGYSSCHWCHVMAHESFEDDEVAAGDERSLRQRQGRPRGATRRRRDLHGRRPGDDRTRRLADDGVHHARRQAVLRRHVLPQAAVPAAARCGQRCMDEQARRADEEHRGTDECRATQRVAQATIRAAGLRPDQRCPAGACQRLRQGVGRVRPGTEVPGDDTARGAAPRQRPRSQRRPASSS